MNVAIWRAPILLALASAVGLVSALVADGIWDALSWLGLGIPVAVITWYWWRSASRRAA